MDRTGASARSGRYGARRPGVDEVPLPSRTEALGRLTDALESRTGPVLLTGDAGAGKTRLLARTRDALPASWRLVRVDLSPAVGAVEFYRLLLHALGVTPGGSFGDARAALVDFLRDRSADGERWVVAVEECQTASADVLEEVRVLGNLLEAPGVLAGLVLSGQTPLTRRLAAPAMGPLASRLAAHVHLLPISVAELAEWLVRLDAEGDPDPDVVERLHRDASGNPRRVRQRLGALSRVPPIATPAARPLAESEPVREPARATRSAPTRVAPVIANVKPPLQIGEGIVEVGWDAPPETDAPTDEDAVFDDGAPPAPADEPIGTSGGVVVEDHYAELQAWEEWARNQGRDPDLGPPDEAAVAGDREGGEVDPDERADRLSPTLAAAGVWADGQQGFAPYSQLFTRLRPTRDPC